MTNLMIWGGLGLLFGAAVQHCGFATAEGVYGAASFRRGGMVRTVLYTLGIGMMLTAFLCYLAVIDVDWVEVLPLGGGTVLGGVLFGAAAGLAGIVPGTALAGIGGGRLLESLSAVVGCVAGAYLAGILPLDAVNGLFPAVEGTLFRMRLDGPYLLDGGFLALACLGALVCVVGLTVPMRKRTVEDAAWPEDDLNVSTPAPMAEHERQTKAFVALIPEEEPLVVDTVGSGENDELKALDAISLTVVTDEETDGMEEDMPMERAERKRPVNACPADDKPVMEEHPELDPMPEEASTMQRLEDAQEQMGILPPTEELDMPVGARALRSVTEAAAEETPPEDGKKR